MSLLSDLQAASTLMLCGLIWVVQLVHYPSFRFVSRGEFRRFHAFHGRRISVPVVLLMPVEAVCAVLLAKHDPTALPLLGTGKIEHKTLVAQLAQNP